MTFDDDFLQLVFDGETKRIPCRQAGVDWPPPERLTILGVPMVQTRRSDIPDELRAELRHVCRGAEYVVDKAAI